MRLQWRMGSSNDRHSRLPEWMHDGWLDTMWFPEPILSATVLAVSSSVLGRHTQTPGTCF